MPPKLRNIAIIAAVSMALAIILGAFGAHKLKDILSTEQMAVYKTASEYHMTQTLGLFAMLLLGQWLNLPHTKRFCFLLLAGITMFSGSLYLLSLRSHFGYGAGILGPVTPAGGLLMIISWLWFAISIILRKT